MEEKPNVEVAIYTDERNVTEVMQAIPLPFDVQPFPFEDKPNGPKTNVMRYTGAWNDDYDRILRHMKRVGTIRRFSRNRGTKARSPKKGK